MNSTRNTAGDMLLRWLLRIAIYGVTMGVAMLLAVVALLLGASPGAVLIGWFVAGVGASFVADIATRPLAYARLAAVVRGVMARLAMTANALASRLPRLRAP